MTVEQDKNILNRKVDIDVVMERAVSNLYRCIYIDGRRVIGGKPYVSEDLLCITRKTTVGDILFAFTSEELKEELLRRESQ